MHGLAPAQSVFRTGPSGVCMGVNMFDHELDETPPMENYDERLTGCALASAAGAAFLPML
jgi:hypothetical protein